MHTFMVPLSLPAHLAAEVLRRWLGPYAEVVDFRLEDTYLEVTFERNEDCGDCNRSSIAL